MYIGIDLGGTNIAVGLVDSQGTMLSKRSLPTIHTRQYTEIVKDMASLCEAVTKDAGYTMHDVISIGIGSPGSVDHMNGVILYCNNISKLSHAPIAEELRKYFDLPVYLENDGNAAAFGEYTVNGDGADSYVFVTLGTGIGGGIILNGSIYRGFNGIGGEIGHTAFTYNGRLCTCGRKGCWEAYASVTALIRQTADAIDKNPDSIMCESAKENGITGRTAFDAAKLGDAAACAVVDRYVLYVAGGITSLINTFQPEKLVIGGGISKEGDRLLLPVREYDEKYGYNKYSKRTQIEIATLFNDAGIIGAALASK